MVRVLENVQHTYADMFIYPQCNPDISRLAINTAPDDMLGLHSGGEFGMQFPVVVANMNAVSGKRMAETVARRGGLTVLPQDLPLAQARAMIVSVHSADKFLETPVRVARSTVISHVGNLIMKRAHRAALVMHGEKPVGVVNQEDCGPENRLLSVSQIISDRDFHTMKAGMNHADMLHWFAETGQRIAPVMNDGKLQGILTAESVVRSTLFKPAENKAGNLMVAAAVGINGNPVKRAIGLVDAGADVLVLDTAHGHQLKMLRTIEAVSNVIEVPVVAGNVVTGDKDIKALQATQELIDAGADGVKVGVGPGAMCTTRIATGVGRPQFDAVLECATTARELGAFVWADGGVRYPRDVALALAAGASSAMVGSLFINTNESPPDAIEDSDKRWYKEGWGMASHRAVDARTAREDALQRRRKSILDEGISTSHQWLDSDPTKTGVEYKAERILAGLISAAAYTGVDNLADYYEKAIVGVGSPAGYAEGFPLGESW